MLHSTRGGAATLDGELHATADWFSNPTVPAASRVSAHVIIGDDGTLIRCVPLAKPAWHARWYNPQWLGAELVQRHLGDPISDAQYATLAWWLTNEVRPQFPFPWTDQTLPQHWEIPPGKEDGKTDLESPFDRARLLALLNG